MSVTNTNSLAESLAKEVCQTKGYRYEKFLGRGGMGDVFQIADAAGTPRALKILRDADPLAQVLFSSEIEALKKHGNPFTVALHDWGEGRCFWYVMDFFPENLQGWIQTHPDPLMGKDQGLGFFGQALRGLAAWHTGPMRICHGDFNPTNILLDVAANRAVLSDPSLASIRGPRGTNYTSQRPREGGTPGFMDPQPDTSGTPQGDVYQAGATLYALLVRQPELPASGLLDAARSNTALPEALKLVILRCLDPDLSRRYRDASELARDFESALRPITPAQPKPNGGPLRRWIAAHRRAVVRAAHFASLVLTVISSLYSLREAVHWYLRTQRNNAVETRRPEPIAIHPLIVTPSSTPSMPPSKASDPSPAKEVVAKGSRQGGQLRVASRQQEAVLSATKLEGRAGPKDDGAFHRRSSSATALPSTKSIPVERVAFNNSRKPETAIHPSSAAKTIQVRSPDGLALGDAAQTRGDLQEAQRLYLLAAAARPRDPAPRRALGLLYRHVHDDAGARDQLGQYLRWAPNAPDREEIERIIRMLEP
jgi:serine/threonine protein kinase